MPKLPRRKPKVTVTSAEGAHPTVLVDESNCICIVGVDGVRHTVSNVDTLMIALKTARNEVRAREAKLP